MSSAIIGTGLLVTGGFTRILQDTPENRIKALKIAKRKGGILCNYWPTIPQAVEALGKEGWLSLGKSNGTSIRVSIESAEA